jgi:DNA-directed RNA polymerase subunit M/transcription elongation factor TFIIS
MSKLVLCDDCGKIMHLHSQEQEKKWKCICGFIREHKGDVLSVEKINKTEVGEGTFKPEKRAGFPHTCKKCGFDKADVDTISAFYSDESDISLFRCQKCGHVERVTDGTSN